MTTEAKTPEDEARAWASDWAWDGTMYWKLLDSEEELLGMQFAIKAHLAGQAVGEERGYLRALEKARLWCVEEYGDKEENQWPNCTSGIRLYRHLKSTHTKGGA